MRRVISVLLLAGLALPAGFAQSALADTISVALDEVQTVTFPSQVATVNVGNPAIADITMIDARRRLPQPPKCSFVISAFLCILAPGEAG